MVESKSIKINLKELIQDFIFAYADKDDDAVEELKISFEEVYYKQTPKIKRSMVRYVINHSCVKENLKISEYFRSFSN